MEKSIGKITTIIGLAAFSVFAAFKLSEILIEKEIVTADKNLIILLSFFAIFGLLTLIVVSIFKSFGKSNELTIKGDGNTTFQDVGNDTSKSKDNKLKIEGKENKTAQDVNNENTQKKENSLNVEGNKNETLQDVKKPKDKN